jgi:hypothetical protein
VRVARDDDELPGGTFIPAGSKLFFCPYVTHRQARHFPDPERFDPQRFSEEAKRDRPKFAYFPFGGGPRLCIGQTLAKMEGSTRSCLHPPPLSLRTCAGPVHHARTQSNAIAQARHSHESASKIDAINGKDRAIHCGIARSFNFDGSNF